ncbi:MAG TPA: hypothetical protein VIK74_08835, partial [Parasegetibacter sp.]
TTQQLNEFDRIWLQFKKRNWELNLGDIDIRQNTSYFLHFYKRLQGISFETKNTISSNSTNRLLVSGSIAKGKFTRNVFQGLEGNQGPYRLSGASNEFFFVVLAGTERVFIDGELLQRGEDQDYVINYNTAEITFTPKRMITKDSRIQVEFEYADRNFLNANIYLADEININNRLNLRISAFNNSDAKNSPINQTLDAPQKQFLHDIGDSINRAFYPVAQPDSFGIGKILYARKDTNYNGITEQIYVYDTTRDGDKYHLSFLSVGQGNGDYVPDFSGANGKVYKWIQPENGIKQGSFAPVAFLVTPKKQQIVSIGADYQISKNTLLITDFAYSNYDVNTFSSLDKSNDGGYAAKLQLRNLHRLSQTKRWTLNTELEYEWVDENFRPLERLRNVEFSRDWGMEIIPSPATEHVAGISFRLMDSVRHQVGYQFKTYQRSDGFSGFRQMVNYITTAGGFRINALINLTNSENSFQKGYFFRPLIDVSRRFPKLKNYMVGAIFSQEKNLQRNKFTDTLSVLSFAFETFSVYLRSDQSQWNKWGITYFTRQDKTPVDRNFEHTDRSHNLT